MLAAIKVIIMSLLFIAAGGGAFSEWGQRHRVLVLFASLISIVGGCYLFFDVYDDFGREVHTSTLQQDEVQPAQKKHRYTAGESFADCVDTCPRMVIVPAGKQNTEKYVLELPNSIAIGKFEVSFLEWEQCVFESDCKNFEPEDQGWGKGRRPVINVSWTDAENYTRWLSKKTGANYRLPTEMEWEYVARLDNNKYPWSADQNELLPANCRDCVSTPWNDPGKNMTAPVNSLTPNMLGIYHLAGNVSEWTQDCWSQNFIGGKNLGECLIRVVRGGSWIEQRKGITVSSRFALKASTRHSLTGFRVIRELN